jgi:hypothetical protein
MGELRTDRKPAIQAPVAKPLGRVSGAQGKPRARTLGCGRTANCGGNAEQDAEAPKGVGRRSFLTNGHAERLWAERSDMADDWGV